MRILLVTLVYAPAWRYGGLVAWAVEHARSLAAAGHEVTVLTSDFGCDPSHTKSTEDAPADGARVLRFPATPRLGGRSPAMEAALTREAAAHDVVHVSGFWQWGVALATRAAKAAGKPCVLSPHGGLTREVWGKKPFAKRLFFLLRGRASLCDASAVHFVSPLEQATARGLPAGKSAFALAPSIDASFWTPDVAERETTRHSLGLGPDERLIIWAGRVHPVKGLDLLPAVLAGLTGMSWRLLLVGGIEDEAEARRVREGFATKGLTDRVEWQPAQPRETLRDLFRAADLLVLPSHHESSGIVALEAAGCGCPALVSEGAGIGPSLVAAGAGWREPRNPQRWAAHLREILTMDEAERVQRGARASQWAETHGRAAVAKRWTTIYTNLMAGKPLSPETMPPPDQLHAASSINSPKSAA